MDHFEGFLILLLGRFLNDEVSKCELFKYIQVQGVWAKYGWKQLRWSMCLKILACKISLCLLLINLVLRYYLD